MHGAAGVPQQQQNALFGADEADSGMALDGSRQASTAKPDYFDSSEEEEEEENQEELALHGAGPRTVRAAS